MYRDSYPEMAQRPWGWSKDREGEADARCQVRDRPKERDERE